MKHVKLYLTALLFAALGITGCDDNWDTPPLVTPEATITANTTILELKQAYWFEDYMGVDTIGTKENGDHIVIKGRVVSSDESGNIYKNMVIDDGTAAITLSIDANSLYNTYRFGQEIVIDATDMYIGNYQGLQQLGTPEYNAEYDEVQMARMPLEFFQEHAQLNGLPEPTLVDTLVVPSISALPTTPEGIIAYQSKLVRFDNVQFDGGGELPFSESEQTVSRTISDGTASLTLRNSGYANFYNRILPEGTGSVVGILGYYRGTWQLTLRSYEDCIFNGEVLPGMKGNPYTVSQAIEGQGNNSGWVKGYIVGAVAPNKETVSSNSDIEWTAPFSLPNTLVIAESADVRDYTKCLVINLPQNSELRQLANLADNANNLGAEILLKGTFANLYGMAGITENAGTTEEFEFTPVFGGDGSEESPFEVSDVMAGVSGSDMWVTGYIVGFSNGSDATESAVFSAENARDNNILIAGSANETDIVKCVCVALPSGDVRNAVNLKDNAGNLGKKVSVQGDLETLYGIPGVRNTSAYKF